MVKGKKFRKHGKLDLSVYFKRFREGDNICVTKNLSIRASFPKRINGKSGKIIGSRGSCCLIKLSDLDKEKTFIIHPIHLKLLKEKHDKKC